MIDVFPAAQQDQIRAMIAGSLQGVVTQTLLPTIDGHGRVAALEILQPDDAIRNLIRQGEGRADLLVHADRLAQRHADDRAVAGRTDSPRESSRPTTRSHVSSRRQELDHARAALRRTPDNAAQPFRGEAVRFGCRIETGGGLDNGRTDTDLEEGDQASEQAAESGCRGAGGRTQARECIDLEERLDAALREEQGEAARRSGSDLRDRTARPPGHGSIWKRDLRIRRSVPKSRPSSEIDSILRARRRGRADRRPTAPRVRPTTALRSRTRSPRRSSPRRQCSCSRTTCTRVANRPRRRKDAAQLVRAPCKGS